MVSIIKNQLLKHLSRFTKNLSADKINLSTFKGEGELSNLQLDETVLTDLLELPSWLQLTSASCNKVAFRIQWTKLKSVPICLTLDEVLVEVETCEELRSTSIQQGLSSLAGPAKYSFINKVIDGMTVIVNTVRITFKSPAFRASVQMLRIVVESKSPSWQKCDLRMTRLKEPERGQILIFKELEWQTVRIEANSTKDKTLTPLRLLTNHASCRIIIKKRLSDSLVLGSCLVLILDDLLWVLTDSQLKAALCFVGSLTGLVQKATELTRTRKAARKLEVLPEYQAQVSQKEHVKDSGSALSRIFSRYDFIETSYHFLLKHIDLHLCDDPGAGRSVHPDLQEGGALQINLQQLQLDYYPYHLALGSRKHWLVYREEVSPHTQWLNQSLSTFRARLLDAVDLGASSGRHAPLGRTAQQQQQLQQQRKSIAAQGLLEEGGSVNRRNPNTQGSSAGSGGGNPLKTYILQELSKLMTSCFVLRVKDFTLYQVTTPKRKQKPKVFIAGDRHHTKEEETLVHAEFTYYYYPGDKPFPLPSPKFYSLLNPVQINFDLYSCVWANAFALNLHQSLLAAAATQENMADLFYVDVKLEAMKVKVVLDNGGAEYPNQRDRPRQLQIHVERASLTNVRSLEHSSRADLAKCVDTLQSAPLFYGVAFPAFPDDKHVVTEKFLQHLAGVDHIRPAPHVSVANVSEFESSVTRTLMWTEARDIWCVSLEPVSAWFAGAPADLAAGTGPVPLCDSFPVTLWAHWDNSSSVLSVLAHVAGLVSAQINHYQYLFLLRAMERLGETATVMSVDSRRIQGEDGPPPPMILAGFLLPQVEVTFVMASQTPGRECHGSGDLESVVPDSMSLAEEGVRIGATSLSSSPSLEGPLGTIHEGGFNVAPPGIIMNSHSMSATKQPPALSIPDNINVSFNTVKKGWKGLSNMVTTLDSVLKASPDDMTSDTASQRSDASSDSERYLLEGQQIEGLDAMFRAGSMSELWQPSLEVASEVTEEIDKLVPEGSISSPSEGRSPDDSTGKRRDLVSLATVKCGQVALIQQSQGFSSALKLQIASVSTDECGAIPLHEFQSKFGCRSRAWTEVSAVDGATPRVSVRFEHTVEVKLGSQPHSWSKNNLKAEVHDLEMELNMSTLVGLADLIEDEVPPHPFPMEIGVQNIKLQLNEDRPPAHITSPGPVPIHLKILDLVVKSDSDGILSVESRTDISAIRDKLDPSEDAATCAILESTLNKLKQSNEELKAENTELKRRLGALEKVTEENCSLRQQVEECQLLRTCLMTAQDEVARLLEEKRNLIDRLRAMHEQLENPPRNKR